MTEIFVPLSQNFFHDLSVDVGETEVSSLEAVGELFVVEAEEVEEGGVEVVDVDFAVDHSEAEFVALAVDVPLLEAGAGHPHCEGFDVVVAADGFAVFAHWGAAEFSAPDDEGVF